MMTMVKTNEDRAQPEPQQYFQEQAMHRLPLDHLVGQVRVTNEFVLTGERARLSVHWNCCHSKTFRSQELTSLHSSAWSSMTRIYPRPDLTVGGLRGS